MLLFDVNGQTLTRKDHFNPATDSQEYLKVQFTFKSTDWSGKTKTALFRLDDTVYKSVLNASGICSVPNEVLVGVSGRYAQINGSQIYVSLIGEYSTTRITTNEICVKVNISGFGDAETPANPTESEYQQMTAVVADAVAEAENARVALVGVKDIFANAIKGNLSGATIMADDVSPIAHNPVVKVRSKNMFLPMAAGATATMAGVVFTYNSDGSVKLKGTATTSANFVAGEIYLAGGVYYLCDFAVGNFPNNTQARTQVYSNSTGKSIMTRNNFASTAVGGGDSFLPDGSYQCRVRIEGGHTYDCTLYPTLFKEEQPTAYTPYTDPTTATVSAGGVNYTPKSDGVVDGIPSTALAGSISTNNAKFTIDCEYIKDSNKVIEKLTNAILALGGTV